MVPRGGLPSAAGLPLILLEISSRYSRGVYQPCARSTSLDATCNEVGLREIPSFAAATYFKCG